LGGGNLSRHTPTVREFSKHRNDWLLLFGAADLNGITKTAGTVAR
jgi:hypothetical protein